MKTCWRYSRERVGEPDGLGRRRWRALVTESGRRGDGEEAANGGFDGRRQGSAGRRLVRSEAGREVSPDWKEAAAGWGACVETEARLGRSSASKAGVEPLNRSGGGGRSAVSSKAGARIDDRLGFPVGFARLSGSKEGSLLDCEGSHLPFLPAPISLPFARAPISLPFPQDPIFQRPVESEVNQGACLIAKVFPSAKKFRSNRIMPELEEKLDMFGRVVATGADVWVPNSGVLPPELGDVEEVASSKEGQQDDEANTVHTDNHYDLIIGDSQSSHNTRPITPKKKRVRTTKSEETQMLIGHIEDLISAAKSISSAISSSIASRKCLTIADALEEISKFPEIFDDLDFYDFAVQYIQDRNQREAFMGLPADRKVWFLKRRYHTSFTSLL
ncbi:hypothetical protein M5K25_009574 [Dendrobium thyrsiflorum]|uniref:Uncharacterized protein n=1 Tax=Dendrobium thyrsiflorum TaxID=117978 RepID=A0ABD0VD54_DENTH